MTDVAIQIEALEQKAVTLKRSVSLSNPRHLQREKTKPNPTCSPNIPSLLNLGSNPSGKPD